MNKPKEYHADTFTPLFPVVLAPIQRVQSSLQGSLSVLFTIRPPRVHCYGESITYSADGKSLLVPVEKRATSPTETAIGCYDAETGKSQRTIPTRWDFVSAVVPTKDGRLIAAGTVGADDDDDPSGSVQIFDLPSGEAQQTYPVVVSAISPDGRWMSSFDNNGIYHPVLWDLKDGKRFHDLTPKNASHVIFRSDGEEIAVTHGDSEAIDFVSTSSGEITKSLPGGGYGLGRQRTARTVGCWLPGLMRLERSKCGI